MKTIEELFKQIKNVQEDIELAANSLDYIKSEVEKLKNNGFEPTPKDWMPQAGEIYYFADMALSKNFYRYTNDDYDNSIIKYNRIFKTEEECQLYCDIQRALRDASREFKYGEENYCLYCYTPEKELFFNYDIYCKRADLYFDSEETIQNLIDKFGEENVKRYYLEVY